MASEKASVTRGKKPVNEHIIPNAFTGQFQTPDLVRCGRVTRDAPGLHGEGFRVPLGVTSLTSSFIGVLRNTSPSAPHLASEYLAARYGHAKRDGVNDPIYVFAKEWDPWVDVLLGMRSSMREGEQMRAPPHFPKRDVIYEARNLSVFEYDGREYATPRGPRNVRLATL